MERRRRDAKICIAKSHKSYINADIYLIDFERMLASLLMRVSKSYKTIEREAKPLPERESEQPAHVKWIHG